MVTNIVADNNFLTLSLSESWNIASPKLKGLPQPNGPPAVANGFVPINLSIFESLADLSTSTDTFGTTLKTSTSTAASFRTSLPSLPPHLRSGSTI